MAKDKKVSFIIGAKDHATAVLKKVHTGLSSIGKGLSIGTASVVGGLTAAAVGFGAIISKALEFGGNLKDASDRLGIATDQLAALRYAGQQAGMGVEDVDTAIKFMLKNLADLGKADTFGKLGLNMLELRGKSPAAAFADIIGALEGVTNASDRMSIAMEIFGKQGGNVLTMTGEGIRKATDEAYKFGIALDQATAGRMEGLGDSWDKIKAAVMGAGLSFTAVLAGPLEKIAAKMEEFAASGKLRKWAQEVGAAVIDVAKIVITSIPQAIIFVLEVIQRVAQALRGWQGLWLLVSEGANRVASVVFKILQGVELVNAAMLRMTPMGMAGVFDKQIEQFKAMAAAAGEMSRTASDAAEESKRQGFELASKNQKEQDSIQNLQNKVGELQKSFEALANSFSYGDEAQVQATKAIAAIQSTINKIDELQKKQAYVSLGAGPKPVGTVFGDEQRLRELERTE